MLHKNEQINRSLTEMGFEEYTEIQRKTMPLIEAGKDVIGHSQTGTGKTAAFTLPLLEVLDYDDRHIQAIIICPTRELAVQVKNEIDRIGAYLPELKTVAIYGGEPIGRQIHSLKFKPQVVVGTPGRLIDHINRKLIRLKNIRYLVLDEADEMMKMGFKDDIETILDASNKSRQTVMFSATMPKPIIKISKQYMDNPEVVSVVAAGGTNKDITQYYYTLQEQHKIEGVARLLHVYNPKRTLIFCNTKRKVDKVTRELTKKGYNVQKIHGDLPQTQRLQVLEAFHTGTVDLLVATDVAARGLDIKEVEVVINFDVPEKPDFYVHRIGRTGRIGHKGYSFTLVSKREVSTFNYITKVAETTIKKRNIPTPEKVIQVKQAQQIIELEETMANINTSPYLETAYRLLKNRDPLEVVSALLHKMEKKDVSDQVQGNINEDFRRGGGRDSARSGDSKRYHLNVGRNDGVTAKMLANFIAKKTNLYNRQIQDISISKNSSFFSTPANKFNTVMKSMTNIKIQGKLTSIREAKSSK